MRSFALMAMLMVSACNAPETRRANEARPEQPTQQEGGAAAEPVQNKVPATAQHEFEPTAHPCRMQGKKTVTDRLKAIGTEPFWAAEVDGRCVTYKTPEDQQGTRIWAHFDMGPQAKVWKGALNGREFQLIVKSAGPQGCSDGMSDKAYPLDAVLHVEGETRNGCADRL